MSEFNSLYENWKNCADFAVVYLREAHAADEWPMGSHVKLCQARTLQERLAAARGFIANTGLAIPLVYADCIDDRFMREFAAHPQRFFVLGANGTLLFKARPHEGGYDIRDLHESLEELCR